MYIYVCVWGGGGGGGGVPDCACSLAAAAPQVPIPGLEFAQFALRTEEAAYAHPLRVTGAFAPLISVIVPRWLQVRARMAACIRLYGRMHIRLRGAAGTWADVAFGCWRGALMRRALCVKCVAVII